MGFFGKKIKVLVVDDSILIRQVLSDIVASDLELELVGTASDGQMALEKVRQLKPDVLTLDVEMPRMDGIACLRHLMKEHPLPVVMVSSITYEDGFKTLQALDAGAFDYVQKPRAQASSSLNRVAADILAKIKAAAQSDIAKKFAIKNLQPVQTVLPEMALALPPKLSGIKNFSDYVIAIGISTGGPPCVTKILEALPASSPPVLIVQHMPKEFTKAMAERNDKLSRLSVKEAENGDVLKPGAAFLAPGHSHITLSFKSGVGTVVLSQKGTVSGHQPSADVLFENVAASYGRKAIGVLMTGMGRDGATQLKVLREKGAHTIAQDEASCVVFGMPRAAIREGAADEVLSLDGIVSRLVQIAKLCS